MPEQEIAKLGEYGIAGILILVIISVMGLLLRHVLNQASLDREEWKKQSTSFLAAIDGISKHQIESSLILKSVAESIVRLRDDIDSWRSR